MTLWNVSFLAALDLRPAKGGGSSRTGRITRKLVATERNFAGAILI